MTAVVIDTPVVPSFPTEDPAWSVPEADWAERAVCGTVLLWPERYAEVRDVLRLSDFHDFAAARVWQAIVDTHAAGVAPDALAVKARLVATKQFEAVTPGAYLRMVDAIPRGIDLPGRAEHVRTAAKYRALQKAFWGLCRRATLMADTPDELIAHADRVLKGVGAWQASADAILQGDRLTTEALTQIERVLSGGDRGLLTGFRQFDYVTGGLEPGQLIILAGRPGTGKTSLASGIAWHVARVGKVVLFISLEMGVRELALRFACLHTGLSYADAKAFLPLTTRDRAVLLEALAAIENSGIAIAEDARTVARVRQHARALKATDRLDLVVVDYLQLMRSDAVKRGDSRVYEIGDISIELKALARELEVPVIALAQLNRNIEQRAGDRKPQLSDLRDSGQIEQDADLVAFTHRSDGSPDHQVDLIIRKHRNGPTADLLLHWEKACMRFSDVS